MRFVCFYCAGSRLVSPGNRQPGVPGMAPPWRAWRCGDCGGAVRRSPDGDLPFDDDVDVHAVPVAWSEYGPGVGRHGEPRCWNVIQRPGLSVWWDGDGVAWPAGAAA